MSVLERKLFSHTRIIAEVGLILRFPKSTCHSEKPRESATFSTRVGFVEGTLIEMRLLMTFLLSMGETKFALTIQLSHELLLEQTEAVALHVNSFTSISNITSPGLAKQ